MLVIDSFSYSRNPLLQKKYWYRNTQSGRKYAIYPRTKKKYEIKRRYAYNNDIVVNLHFNMHLSEKFLFALD